MFKTCSILRRGSTCAQTSRAKLHSSTLRKQCIIRQTRYIDHCIPHLGCGLQLNPAYSSTGFLHVPRTAYNRLLQEDCVNAIYKKYWVSIASLPRRNSTHPFTFASGLCLRLLQPAPLAILSITRTLPPLPNFLQPHCSIIHFLSLFIHPI